MWYCFECEEYFDSPNEDREYHSELAGMGGITYETFCTCPMCGSTDVEEATKVCDLCGETYIRLEWVGNEQVCPSCYDELSNDMEQMINNTAKWFNIEKDKAVDLISGYLEKYD